MSDSTPNTIQPGPVPTAVALGTQTDTLEDGSKRHWIVLRISDPTGVKAVWLDATRALGLFRHAADLCKAVLGAPSLAVPSDRAVAELTR
jgi:hypothetical protein